MHKTMFTTTLLRYSAAFGLCINNSFASSPRLESKLTTKSATRIPPKLLSVTAYYTVNYLGTY